MNFVSFFPPNLLTTIIRYLFLKPQREALFAELQLEEAKVAATPPRAALVSTRTQRSAPSRRGLQMPKREREEILPRRQSTRLKEGFVNEIQRCGNSKWTNTTVTSNIFYFKMKGITLEWTTLK